MTDTGELAALGGWSALLRRLTGGGSLSRSESAAAMAEILAGTATDAQIAGFIVALRMKGETTDELSGLLDAMLDAGTAVHLDLDAAGCPRSSTSWARVATPATPSTSRRWRR